eukprot:145617_1
MICLDLTVFHSTTIIQLASCFHQMFKDLGMHHKWIVYCLIEINQIIRIYWNIQSVSNYTIIQNNGEIIVEQNWVNNHLVGKKTIGFEHSRNHFDIYNKEANVLDVDCDCSSHNCVLSLVLNICLSILVKKKKK